MPILINFLWQIFSKFLGRKAANITIATSAMTVFLLSTIAALTVLVVTINAILGGMSLAVPAIANDVWSWFMPSNARALLTAIIIAKFARMTFDFYMYISKTKLDTLIRAATAS